MDIDRKRTIDLLRECDSGEAACKVLGVDPLSIEGWRIIVTWDAWAWIDQNSAAENRALVRGYVYGCTMTAVMFLIVKVISWLV